MVEQDKPEPPPRRPRRRWLRRVGWALLGLVVLLAIFHRPIVFEGTRYFIVRAARQQNLDLDYEIGGSIFSTLTVSNLRATPTEPGPVQRIEIGNIDLRYSLWDALRKGLPALLDLVQVRDVFVEITPSEEPPPGKQEDPQQFKFPALFPKTLQLENINFLSHGAAGDTVVEGLWFTLLPDRPGVLRLGALDIPGVRKWTEVSGRTTFRDRNLMLTELQIGPEIALERFNLDASQLDDARLGIGLVGRFFDAPVSIRVEISDLNAANDLSAAFRVDGLQFARIGEYLNLEMPVAGVLELAAGVISGRPDEPQSWRGTIGARLGELATGGQSIGTVRLGATFENGRATANVALDAGVAVQAEAELPEKVDDLVETRAAGVLLLFLPEVGTVIRGPQEVGGDLVARLPFQLSDGVFAIHGGIRSRFLSAAGARVSGLRIDVDARKDLRVEEGAPPFRGATGTIALRTADAEVSGFGVDEVAAVVALENATLQLRNIGIVRSSNSVKASGEVLLPDDMATFAKQPWKVAFQVNAPAMHEFVAEGGQFDLQGMLDISGTATSDGARIRGDLQIEGRDFGFNGLNVPTIDGAVVVEDDQATLHELVVHFDEDNHVQASGEVQLKEPYAYRGTVKAALENLSIFDPVTPEPVAGSFTMDWEGEGTVTTPRHSGGGRIVLTNGQYGALAALNAEVEAAYSPGAIDVPVLRASAEMGGIEATASWRDDALSISDLRVQWKDLQVLTGSLTAPLALAHFGDIDRLIPNDGPVQVNLETPDLALTEVFARLGDDPAPVSGSVEAKLTASGTVAELVAGLAVRATNLEAAVAGDAQPVNANLDVSLRDNRLTVTGRIVEPRIQPVTIEGAIPLNVAQVKRDGALPSDTPLDVHVSMPDSPLGFVTSLVPIVRFIDGVAGVDLRVSGTTAQPRVAGNAHADIRHLRLNNEGLPPITNLVARLDATTERMTVSAFRGEVGGGAFGAEGIVDFGGGQPVFDLAFGTRNALVMQDEALTLRISSRIGLRGPLDSATLSGEVFVTRSRFFKDIDILPIGLPGRPAPQPPEVPPAPGIPDPPLRDWKLDLTIKTADPFLVRGNLANGRVLVDLHVGGTGAQPWMDGSVRIEQLRTSLPFSTLDVDNGLVYFTRDRPFLPQFDIRGTSRIRDYDIAAYVYGDLTNPQASFTSNPPLPQTEIVSLIATGVTSRELAGNPSVLAGRAAMLLFQKIYRSVFHRGSAQPPRDTLLSRIDFELGATDPKTGHQGIGVRFPLTENIVLSSGVDVGGDFRGQVRYLIRFR